MVRKSTGSGAYVPTEKVLGIVAWLLLHGLMTSTQIREVFFRRVEEDGVEKIATQQAVSKVMTKLVGAGYVVAERVLHRGPVVYKVTAAGARLVGGGVRPAKVDLADLHHDLAVVDLWAALVGRDPAGASWITERQIRDRLRPGTSLGRIPDGLVIGPGGERWAVELEASSKDTKRYERIHHVYAERHRVEIPAEAPGWGLDEQLDDYVAGGANIDGVAWFFFGDRLRERAEKAARRMTNERAGAYHETRHLRMDFRDAARPFLPRFGKWELQERRERERREEERRREEAECERREYEERHARRLALAGKYLTAREQEKALGAAENRNRELGGHGASQRERELALIDAMKAKYERQEEEEQQKRRRKDSLRRIFGGGG